jgi:hypothetical protein
MMHLVQSLGLPHWLMLAGALLVIAGCLGLAVSRKKAAEIDDEPVNALLQTPSISTEDQTSETPDPA